MRASCGRVWSLSSWNGTAMRILSLVTPFQVAPPLSPCQNGTHGGDWLSSICRGGSPMQRCVTGSGPGSAGGLTLGNGEPPPPPGPGPRAASLPTPLPVPNLLDCSLGAFLICFTACGANCATVGGGAVRLVIPRSATSTASATTSVSSVAP